MSIFITGDCHGEWNRRFNTKNFPEQKTMTKEDFVIVCGDFGYWTASEQQDHWLDWLNRKPFTTLFVDGNHENFDGLYSMPAESWKGGRIHRVRASVIHLMRGQIFQLEDRTFFTFGGASSHDVQGGILDRDDPEYRRKKRRLDELWIPYRINHVSWWAQELPSEEECQEGLRNLAAAGWKADYIITHCCPGSLLARMRLAERYPSDRLTEYLEHIRQKTRYRRWYFGHYHKTANVGKRETVIYEKIVPLPQGAEEEGLPVSLFPIQKI